MDRLFSSSLVALVSLTSPRKLKVCHFKKGTEICNYSYSNTILAVKLNRLVCDLWSMWLQINFSIISSMFLIFIFVSMIVVIVLSVFVIKIVVFSSVVSSSAVMLSAMPLQRN